MKLGVNIDHVATVRNARGATYPDPVAVALLAQEAGADNITCHLREDRRHITDADVFRLKQEISLPLNFEMAATEEMLTIALQARPQEATIVPEGRQELTTESGLRQFDASLQRLLKPLQDIGTKTVLFIDPTLAAVEQAKTAGAEGVEFHLGEVCDKLARSSAPRALVAKLHEPFAHAHHLGLTINIGHGINYTNACYFQLLSHVVTANIGHAIIGEAISIGIVPAVHKMQALLNDPQHLP